MFKTDSGEELERTVQTIYLEFTVRWITLKADHKSKTMTVAGFGEQLACSLGESDITGPDRGPTTSPSGRSQVGPIPGPPVPEEVHRRGPGAPTRPRPDRQEDMLPGTLEHEGGPGAVPGQA